MRASFLSQAIAPWRRAASLRTLAPGAPLHALDPALDVRECDLRLRKYRFSAFTRNPEDPEALLRARGIDTVVVTGVATNICCESTARDAMMLDFRVVMVADCCALSRRWTVPLKVAPIMSTFCAASGAAARAMATAGRDRLARAFMAGCVWLRSSSGECAGCGAVRGGWRGRRRRDVSG